MIGVRRQLAAASSVALIAAATVMAAPQTAGAVETLDQEQLVYEGNYAVFADASSAQVFTAGRTGALRRIELRILRHGASPPPLFVEIHDVQAEGQPGATVLASTQVPAADITAGQPEVPFESISFATPAAVVAGSKYAVVVHTNGSVPNHLEGYTVSAANSDVYSRGALYASAGSPPAADQWYVQSLDLSFKTYVDTPPPPTPKPTPKPAPTPAPSLEAKCDFSGSTKSFNVIKGTNGNDVLRGTTGRDLIFGYGGDDQIRGRGGKDMLCGGAGKDELYGSQGADRLSGGPGNDRLFGDQGDDVLKGNSGRDVLRGGLGDDRVSGGTGRDEVRS